MIVLSRATRKTARHRPTMMIASLNPEGCSCCGGLGGISSDSASLFIVSISWDSEIPIPSCGEAGGLERLLMTILLGLDKSGRLMSVSARPVSAFN